MKIVILDALTLGDVNWKRLEEFGKLQIYDTTDESEIIERAFEIAKKKIKSGESFAVRCRKRGHRIKSAKGIEIELGARIKENLNAVVSLSSPQWYILIEVLGKKTGIGVVKSEEIIKKEVED